MNISHQESDSNSHLNIIDQIWLSVWMIRYINSLWMTDEWNVTHCLWLGFLSFHIKTCRHMPQKTHMDEPEGVRQIASDLQNQNPLSSCMSGILQKPNKKWRLVLAYSLTGLPSLLFNHQAVPKKLQPAFFHYNSYITDPCHLRMMQSFITTVVSEAAEALAQGTMLFLAGIR